MQHPLLKILPGADNLSARLTILVLACVMVALVFALLAVSEGLGLAPMGMDAMFPWVVLFGACTLLLLLLLLWLVISSGVLKPLEGILQTDQTEKKTGLGNIAATMRELRDEVERTQAELDQSHRTLREVEKLAMVGKLAAGVAHSIRNPLTSVKLRLFSLERSQDARAGRQQDFKVIADAIRHIDSVLTNFLEFSRRPKLCLREISPSQVVNAALDLLENRLASFPVSVMREGEGLPLIRADADQLQEALLNILLNACEAMGYNGNLYVKEWLETVDGGKYVHISIRDSGPGIPEDALDRLFLPFFSTKEQGTGLGLPIAKGILEEHGGDILVDSSQKSGTVFTLIIPVADDIGRAPQRV